VYWTVFIYEVFIIPSFFEAAPTMHKRVPPKASPKVMKKPALAIALFIAPGYGATDYGSKILFPYNPKMGSVATIDPVVKTPEDVEKLEVQDPKTAPYYKEFTETLKKIVAEKESPTPSPPGKKSGGGALTHLPPSTGKVRYEVVGEPCIQKIGEGVPVRYNVAEPKAQRTREYVPDKSEAVEFAVQQKTRKWAASRDVPEQNGEPEKESYSSKKQDA